MPPKIKITPELIEEIKSCCHHGHGASIFLDGSVMQAVSSNDCIARSNPAGGWTYRIAYIDDPEVTEDELEYYLTDYI